MINLKMEKCPPLLRRPAPAPYFHPLFSVFQIPPPGEVFKIYFPPFKKGESELWYSTPYFWRLPLSHNCNFLKQCPLCHWNSFQSCNWSQISWSIKNFKFIAHCLIRNLPFKHFLIMILRNILQIIERQNRCKY